MPQPIKVDFGLYFVMGLIFLFVELDGSLDGWWVSYVEHFFLHVSSSWIKMKFQTKN